MTMSMRRSTRTGGSLALVGLLPALAIASTIHIPANQGTITAGETRSMKLNVVK